MKLSAIQTEPSRGSYDVVIIGGMLISTFLTPFLVPVLYVLMTQKTQVAPEALESRPLVCQ